MIKDIYIIKNKFNNKVYIGQTVNPAQRWAQYKSAAQKKPEAQLITKAMNKYGFDNFWMEILENDVENYDEREKYWIQYYNSLAPNGYNLAEGGKGAGNGVHSPSAVIKEERVLLALVDEIITSDKTFHQLAQEYNVSPFIVSEINLGHTYYNPDLTYPLRDSKKYSEEKIKQVTYALRFELDKSLKDIAQEYHCDPSFLNDINQGRVYFRKYLTYPLRKGKMKYQQEYLPRLLWDLQNSSLSQDDLAKKYNVSKQTISDVNVGRTGRQDNLTYPIRSEREKGRTCFSPNELQLIYQELKNSKLSINKIAQEFGVSNAVISNINRGKIKKYFDPQIEYPIRKR